MSLTLLKEADKKVAALDPFILAMATRRSASFRPIMTQTVNMGADPEFFFEGEGGTVVGAEKVLPKDGLYRDGGIARPSGFTDAQWEAYKAQNCSRFIIDGVAGEINPRPNTCRGNLGNDIIQLMRTLRQALQMNKGKVKANLGSTMVEVSKEELASLDEKNRLFGCAPSSNAYTASAKIDADPEKYLKRGAGGHIHLGINKVWDTHLKTYGPVTGLVWLLDAMVGNTFVLIDRDPSNIERRKNYGRAGEYRLPKHGLEYRTLSNVWLTACPLFSLAFGLARQAVEIYMDTSPNGIAIRKAMRDAVTTEDLVKAIDGNDFDQALVNYIKLESMIIASAGETSHHTITKNTAPYFIHFVAMIHDHGLRYWFKEDPLEHWCNMGDSHDWGIYNYLSGTVRVDQEKHEKHPVLAAYLSSNPLAES